MKKSDRFKLKKIVMTLYAVCPGGEGAVLKTVDQKWFAGSNPVCSVYRSVVQLVA